MEGVGGCFITASAGVDSASCIHTCTRYIIAKAHHANIYHANIIIHAFSDKGCSTNMQPRSSIQCTSTPSVLIVHC